MTNSNSQSLSDKIKYITLTALLSDDTLVEQLTLKGGNALDMIYRITDRGSKDLDFSIASDFDDSTDIKERIYRTLSSTFLEHDYIVLDFNFEVKPIKISEELADFWGGYSVDFKIVTKDMFNKHNGTINENLRRNAVIPNGNTSSKIEIDISKHEYTESKKRVDYEGFSLYVYTPTVILLEKIRAICQQTSEYGEIVKRNRVTGRARDFYDIYSILEHESSNIDLCSDENIELLKNVFGVKRVPLEFIKLIPNYKEYHKENFASLKNTINDSPSRDFDFYYDYVIEHLQRIEAKIL